MRKSIAGIQKSKLVDDDSNKDRPMADQRYLDDLFCPVEKLPCFAHLVLAGQHPSGRGEHQETEST